MKQLIQGLLFLSVVSSSFASTEVCIDHKKKEITLSAHYYFYGDEATRDIAQDCVAEINRQFNNNHQILLNKQGDWLKVKVNVTQSILNEHAASSISAANYDPKINFVRIDTPTKGSRVNVSEHGLSSNYGYFIKQNGLGYSTTCTHEFAHGLGLVHIDPCDWRGKGVPPIMAARGCLVDKAFQYDPKVKAGEAGGTINPNKRQVHSKEFSLINMGDLKYRWVGFNKECAKQGKVFRKMYRKDGTMYTPHNALAKGTYEAPFVPFDSLKQNTINNGVAAIKRVEKTMDEQQAEIRRIKTELAERLQKELDEGLQNIDELEGEAITIQN